MKLKIPGYKGSLKSNAAALRFYSHDASMFEVRPRLVAFPRRVADIKALVRYVASHKSRQPWLSLTARSAGTDMSGGAINEGIILDLTKHLHRLGRVTGTTIKTQPGVYYRRFAKRTHRKGLLMPAYPASAELCALGGMVANNCGGEKSLHYGKIERYVRSVKAVLADGREYQFEPLRGEALQAKLAQDNYEGAVYRAVHQVLSENYARLAAARPRVHKNSTGYNVWDAWDGTTLDLTKLLVGSQGTLGVITETSLDLMPLAPHSGLVVATLDSLEGLGHIIGLILRHQPVSFESFDQHTLKLALKFLPSLGKRLGIWGSIKTALSFAGDIGLMRRGLPKLILLIEFEATSAQQLRSKLNACRDELVRAGVVVKLADSVAKSQHYWLVRRESFNLLRHKVKNLHTAPFIDDIIVPPERLPSFLPLLTRILDRYRLFYTVAGHIGEGNFHIIPLMDFSRPSERAKIEPVLKEVNQLVLAHGGMLSGEHNDGLIRGPFLAEAYPRWVVEIFRQIKVSFDPQNIFNPHKKTDADWKYSFAHIRRDFD